MKFNMGCGHNRREGYVNVDASPVCEPDVVWNLEQTPWPWPDNCATEVQFIHSLEHMGKDPAVFIAIMVELYRISAPGCVVLINVPHPRHDNFLNDPTHVRPVTAEMLTLFDRRLNDAWKAAGAANSPLAHYTGVDFAVEHCGIMLDDHYVTMANQGRITGEQLQDAMRSLYNVIAELQIRLLVRKD
jgi:hypothetical protein